MQDDYDIFNDITCNNQPATQRGLPSLMMTISLTDDDGMIIVVNSRLCYTNLTC